MAFQNASAESAIHTGSTESRLQRQALGTIDCLEALPQAGADIAPLARTIDKYSRSTYHA
jgi:hypothetical protein